MARLDVRCRQLMKKSTDTSVLRWFSREFLIEHDNFPNGRHDDQVDATTQARKRLTHGGPAILEFLKMQVEAQSQSQPGACSTFHPVRIRTAPGPVA